MLIRRQDTAGQKVDQWNFFFPFPWRQIYFHFWFSLAAPLINLSLSSPLWYRLLISFFWPVKALETLKRAPNLNWDIIKISLKKSPFQASNNFWRNILNEIFPQLNSTLILKKIKLKSLEFVSIFKKLNLNSKNQILFTKNQIWICRIKLKSFRDPAPSQKLKSNISEWNFGIGVL